VAKTPKPVTVDFETHGIQGRPSYPPCPVGVSIKYPKKKAKYYAWGHIEGNNCSWGEAREALKKAWDHKEGLLFQNGKFDLDVAEVHMDLPPPAWDRVHDTLFLLFLDDPHQIELGLKPSAERLLGIPPDEQDDVANWLCAMQPVPGIRISRSKNSEHYFGRYVALAPGTLVGKYANGDTERTEEIFELLWAKTEERQMVEAYDRERKLAPILLRMERRGVPVDLNRLEADVLTYSTWKKRIDEWIIKTIRGKAGINLDSGDQLIKAMVAAKKVDIDKMPLTPTGKYQTNKEALLLGVNDKTLLGMLKYRSQLSTCLNTFMVPWLRVARKSNGLIFTTWNQTKSAEGASAIGTRTGRLSSTPNFQNIPLVFEFIFKREGGDPKKNKLLPKSPFKDLPDLPSVRSYVTPFKNHIFVDRDYSQQEPRILAHFDRGALLTKYQQDPWIDFHDHAKSELEKMGKFYERKPVKNTNLGLIYGMGVGKLAIRNDMSVEESKELKDAIMLLYPGLKLMYKDMKYRARSNTPIRTWGGREYYCEPPKLVNGRIMQFDYKMVNILVQGSAADCTKEAIIRFHDSIVARGMENVWFILLNVHDQVTASVPVKDAHEAMEVLRVAMESVEFDAPMLSEGSVSVTNWDCLVDYDKKGKRLPIKMKGLQ
jgi:DNA polymerase I-like protein with 3'-5' exonuclease and polymerase domains